MQLPGYAAFLLVAARECAHLGIGAWCLDAHLLNEAGNLLLFASAADQAAPDDRRQLGNGDVEGNRLF